MPLEEYFDDKVNESTAGEGGFDVVAPGFYIIRVADVVEKDDNFNIDMEVVGGTKPPEVGKVHREFISLNAKDGNRKRRLAFAMATNLVTKEEIKAARENGSGLAIEYESAVGSHCVIEVEQEKKNVKNEDGEWVPDPNGKIVAKIPYDHIWHVDDPSVKRKGIKFDRTKLETGSAFGGDLPKPKTAKTDDSFF